MMQRPSCEVESVAFPVAEEPCSERFSNLPKATPQEGADLGFPARVRAKGLTCPYCSLDHPTLQVPPDLRTGCSGKARTTTRSQQLAWGLVPGSWPSNGDFLIKSKLAWISSLSSSVPATRHLLTPACLPGFPVPHNGVTFYPVPQSPTLTQAQDGTATCPLWPASEAPKAAVLAL